MTQQTEALIRSARNTAMALGAASQHEPDSLLRRECGRAIVEIDLLCAALSSQPPAQRDDVREFDDIDREVIAKVRRAVEYEDNGDPMKDVIDHDEIVDALRLLVELVDSLTATAGSTP